MILLRWRGLLDRVEESDSFALEGSIEWGRGGCFFCVGGFLLNRVGGGDVRVLCECCGGWGRCRCAIFFGWR